MKTVILSGGLGYRLKEETEFKPKPMVLIGNKPILWHILKIYAHFGFNDFIIALGYKGNYIKQYFINQKHFAYNFSLNTKTGVTQSIKDDHASKNVDNFKITFVDTGLNTLPGERILRIKDYLDSNENFMVTYGDGVADINIKKLVTFHKSHGLIGTITGVHPRSKYGLIRVDKENKVTQFVEKPILHDYVNGGFMVFNKSIFEFLKKGEMEHEALKRIAKIRQLAVYNHDGFWHSMDTYPDVENLNAMWSDKPLWKIWKK